jgi:hypothetical protein
VSKKRRLFHSITKDDNRKDLHRSHAAKSWETGKPSRRMEANVSCLNNSVCSLTVIDVSAKGCVKNRSYVLSDIDEDIHGLICRLAKDKKWKPLFALVDLFKS